MGKATTLSWERLEKENRVRSAIVTGIITAVVLILCILFGLYTPFPPPEEQGLLVDFGTTTQGFGKVEPTTSPVPTPPPLTETAPAVVEEAVNQDIEESVALPEEKPKEKIEVKEEKKPDPVPEPVAEPEPEPEPEEVVDERFQFKNDKFDFSSNTGSEGNTKPGGNMGDPSGSESDNYLGQDSGLGDDGIGWGLAGRGMISKPPTDNKHQEYGDIAVIIRVDRDGNVVEARVDRKNSTITNSALINKYVAYAKKAKFNANQNAAEIQQGYIKFKLSLE